jgi:hypothetical protein
MACCLLPRHCSGCDDDRGRRLPFRRFARAARSLVIPISPAARRRPARSTCPTALALHGHRPETFRQTDTVNVWGFVRRRNTGRVPPTLELRLASGWAYGADDPPRS